MCDPAVLFPPSSNASDAILLSLLLPACTSKAMQHLCSLLTSFLLCPPSGSLSSSLLQATPLLQSHPAFQDKENTEDQFCSVTFGGGLQSQGMAGEAELKEIYLGCLRERGEISGPASSQEGEGGEAERR